VSQTPSSETVSREPGNVAYAAEEPSADHGGPLAPHIFTVHALAKAVDARDGYTHDHSRRVGFYAATLASEMGLDRDHIEMIRVAGVLHDVGKIGIRDAILLKPDRLSPEEFAVMRHVPELSHSICLEAGLPDVARWVKHVHERIDGRGYPDALVASAVPRESRLLHVADAFEAMTVPRIYRPELSLEDALNELDVHSGTQFDPEASALLINLIKSGRLQVGEQPRFGTPSAEELELA